MRPNSSLGRRLDEPAAQVSRSAKTTLDASVTDSVDSAEPPRCAECGRPLSARLSVLAGIGPSCAIRAAVVARWLDAEAVGR